MHYCDAMGWLLPCECRRATGRRSNMQHPFPTPTSSGLAPTSLHCWRNFLMGATAKHWRASEYFTIARHGQAPQIRTARRLGQSSLEQRDDWACDVWALLIVGGPRSPLALRRLRFSGFANSGLPMPLADLPALSL